LKCSRWLEVLLKGTAEHTDRGSDKVFSGAKFLLLASFIPEQKIKARLRLLNLCSSQRLEDEHRSVKE
jgi:hypothetical protein